MTFHLPEHHVPVSPDERPAGSDRGAPAPSEQIERSPERFRTEEPLGRVIAPPSLHESISQLITSQCHPCESDHTVSPPMETEVELTALSLSHLTLCDDAPAVSMPQPEGPSLSEDVSAEDLKSEEWSHLKNAPPVSQKIMVPLFSCLSLSAMTKYSLSSIT